MATKNTRAVRSLILVPILIIVPIRGRLLVPDRHSLYQRKAPFGRHDHGAVKSGAFGREQKHQTVHVERHAVDDIRALGQPMRRSVLAFVSGPLCARQ